VRQHVIVAVVCLVIAVTGIALAQQPAPVSAPTLTDVQKLQIQNLAQRMEIAQLRAQQAQQDYDAARKDAAALVQTLQVPGYTLDLQTLNYVPVPAQKPPTK
jgi:hypothetical protein